MSTSASVVDEPFAVVSVQGSSVFLTTDESEIKFCVLSRAFMCRCGECVPCVIGEAVLIALANDET